MAVAEKEITLSEKELIQKQRADLIKFLITFLVPIILWLIPMPLETSLKLFFVITVWAILSWITVVIPVEVTGFILPCLYLLFNVTTPDVIFEPWQNTVMWGTVALILIGFAANMSGLSMRIAYKLLLKMDTSLRGLIWGFAFAGVIMSFIITDNLTRAIVFTTIAVGICQALGIKFKSKEATALGLAAFFGMSGPSIGTFTAGYGYLINSVFRETAGFNMTYFGWLFHNFIPSIGWTLVSVFAIIKVLKIGKESTFDAKEELEKRYKDLGALTKREKCVFVALVLLVLNFIFISYLGLDPLLIAAFFALFLFVPGIQILSASDFEKIDVKILFVMAGAMAIGTTASNVGVVDILMENIVPLLEGSSISMVFGTFIFSTLANFILTPLAIIFTFTDLFTQMAITAGINPLPVMYALNFGADVYVFPYEFAILLAAFSFGHMNYFDAVKVLLARSLLAILVVALVCIPYWFLIGLM